MLCWVGMVISYFGGNCILVEERERGEDPRLALFLPHTKTSKTRTLEKKANLILTEQGAGKIKSDAFRIDMPGEYDVSRFAVRGVQVNDALVYVMDGKHLTLGFITKSPGRKLEDSELEMIGTVDILVTPMPFGDDKDPTQGLGEFVRAVEPKIVIALTDKPKMKKAIAAELGTDLKSEKKLSASVRDLPDEGFALISLEVQ